MVIEVQGIECKTRGITNLPNTDKLKHKACLCLPISSLILLTTSPLPASFARRTHALPPFSPPGRRALAVASHAVISLVQSSSLMSNEAKF